MEQNVTLQGYKLFYRPVGGSFTQPATTTVTNVDSSNNSIVLSGLEKYVLYDITVLAYSSAGDGPNATEISVRTSEDG